MEFYLPNLPGPTRTTFRSQFYDHRSWMPMGQDMPFSLWQAEFSGHAGLVGSCHRDLRGLRKQDSDRTRFTVRPSLLDTVSRQFSLAESEDIKETAKTAPVAGRRRGCMAQTNMPFTPLNRFAHSPPKGYHDRKDLACTSGRSEFTAKTFRASSIHAQTARCRQNLWLIVPALDHEILHSLILCHTIR